MTTRLACRAPSCEVFGELPQQVVNLSSPILAEQEKVDAVAAKAKAIDESYSKLVVQASRLSEQLNVAEGRFDQLSSRLEGEHFHGVEEDVGLYQEEVDRIASLNELRSWSRVLPWIGLVPASLFYFSSLYFLLRARRNRDR